MKKRFWQVRLVWCALLVFLPLSFGFGPVLAVAPPPASDSSAGSANPANAPFVNSASPSLFQFHLNQGWNLISIPLITDPSPLVVFADLPRPWSLAEWDAVSSSYLPYSQISLRPGVGYWLYLPSAATITVSGQAVTSRLRRTLSPGWNLFGVPFLEEFHWDRVWIHRGELVFSLDQAIQSGIIGSRIYTWWPGGRYLSVREDLQHFRPGVGFWIRLNPPSPGIAVAEETSVEILDGVVPIVEEIASKPLKASSGVLLESIGGWAAKEAIGWALDMLTGKESDTEKVLEQLKFIEGQLDQVMASLSRIEADFTALFQQLRNMEAQLIDTVLNAQVKDYMNRIDTHYNMNSPDGLYFFTHGKTPTTPGITDQMNAFCANVSGAWDIPNSINGIYTGIIPSGGSKGILDSWVDTYIITNTSSWTFQPYNLMQYYQTFESYFAGLLFYQYKGADIYTEVMNHNDPTGQTSKGWLTEGPLSYQSMVRDEVNRFLVCAARMVAYAANLGSVNPSDPLFLAGGDVLARAQFFALQTLNQDHYGLRGAVLVTQDDLLQTGSTTPVLSLNNSAKGVSDYQQPATAIPVPAGPAYDAWDAGQSIFKGSSQQWVLLLADWPKVQPGAGYTITLRNSIVPAPVSPAFSVDTYTDGYVLSSTGTVLYGCGFGWARLGGAQQFTIRNPAGNANPNWKIDSNNVAVTGHGVEHVALTVNNGLSDLSGTPKIQFSKNTYQPSQINGTFVLGTIQDSRHFTYTGINPLAVHFNVRVKSVIHWEVSQFPYNGFVNFTAEVGLWDFTGNKLADGCTPVSWINPKQYNGNYGSLDFVTVPITGTLNPQHTYGLTMKVMVDSKFGYNSYLTNMSATIAFLGASFQFYFPN